MYYHINDIIFLVRFPQFVGSLRRDVWTTAYWRDRPTSSSTSPLSARTLTLSFRLSPIAYIVLCHLVSRLLRFGFSALVESARLTSRSYAVAHKRVVRRANLRPAGRPSHSWRRDRPFVPRARTKSRLVFDLMAIRNYASTPGTARRTHAPQTGPAKRPGAGTFQLLEGITTSVHHLLYLFSAHDHRRAAAKN